MSLTAFSAKLAVRDNGLVVFRDVVTFINNRCLR